MIEFNESNLINNPKKLEEHCKELIKEFERLEKSIKMANDLLIEDIKKKKNKMK